MTISFAIRYLEQNFQAALPLDISIAISSLRSRQFKNVNRVFEIYATRPRATPNPKTILFIRYT